MGEGQFGPALRDVLRMWVYITGGLAVAVLVAGFLDDWRGGFVLAAIGAGLLDVWALVSCLRAWWSIASYRWFWWSR